MAEDRPSYPGPSHPQGLCEDLTCQRCADLKARYMLWREEVRAQALEMARRTMRHSATVLALITLIGCGSSPTRPTPNPVPSPIQVSGSITDTVTGAVIGSFVQSVNNLPALVTVTAPGHHPRRARITSDRPTVDLIPDAAPFDLGFYRQFVRDALDRPGSLQPVRLLTASPSIYIQRTGLSDQTVHLMEARARDAVSRMSGGRLQVAAWETGSTVRPVQAGWIMIELASDPNVTWCGQALTGAAHGRIWLNTGRPTCTRPLHDTLAHEIGHALGFWHTDVPGSLMQPGRPVSHNGLVSDRERYHAAIAFARGNGNTDVDVDSLTSTLTTAAVISD